MEKRNEKMNSAIKAINATVEHANKRLAEITKDGFPFSLEEVKMTVELDSAGIYIHSGTTPIGAIVRARSSKNEGMIKEFKKEIWTAVDAIKIAVEQRKSLKDEAAALADAGTQEILSRNAVIAAGVSEEMLDANADRDREAAAAIVKAAEKAVREANSGLFMALGGSIPLKEAKMKVRGFAHGIEVLAGGKTCLVTRFPKMFNNESLARMTKFIQSSIAGLNEDRRRYFEEVRRVADREERLRALALEIDRVDEAMVRVAAM